jgi:hypothetical protein
VATLSALGQHCATITPRRRNAAAILLGNKAQWIIDNDEGVLILIYTIWGYVSFTIVYNTQELNCVAHKGLYDRGAAWVRGVLPVSEGFRFAARPRYDLFRPPGSGIAMICRSQGLKDERRLL